MARGGKISTTISTSLLLCSIQVICFFMEQFWHFISLYECIFRYTFSVASVVNSPLWFVFCIWFVCFFFVCFVCFFLSWSVLPERGLLFLLIFVSKIPLLIWFYFFKIWNASRIFMSSLRRGHVNLLCIVPILVYVLPKRALFLLIIFF